MGILKLKFWNMKALEEGRIILKRLRNTKPRVLTDSEQQVIRRVEDTLGSLLSSVEVSLVIEESA